MLGYVRRHLCWMIGHAAHARICVNLQHCYIIPPPYFHTVIAHTLLRTRPSLLARGVRTTHAGAGGINISLSHASITQDPATVMTSYPQYGTVSGQVGNEKGYVVSLNPWTGSVQINAGDALGLKSFYSVSPDDTRGLPNVAGGSHGGVMSLIYMAIAPHLAIPPASAPSPSQPSPSLLPHMAPSPSPPAGASSMSGDRDHEDGISPAGVGILVTALVGIIVGGAFGVFVWRRRSARAAMPTFASINTA